MNADLGQGQAVCTLRPTAIYTFMAVAPLLAVSVAATVMAVTLFAPLILLSLLSVTVAWYRFLRLLNIRYTLTVETITVRTGIIARRYDHLELFRVRDYVVQQSAMMRMFGIMSVTLYTTDLTNGTLTLKGIPLSDVTGTIRDLVQQARVRNRIFEIN